MAGNQYKTYDVEDRRALLSALVSDGMSLNEMRRSYGFDYRTVKRHYPNYHAFDVGGQGDTCTLRARCATMSGRVNRNSESNAIKYSINGE